MLTVDQVAERHLDYEMMGAHVSWKDEQGERQLLEVGSAPVVLGRDGTLTSLSRVGSVSEIAAVLSQTHQGIAIERCSRLVSKGQR